MVLFTLVMQHSGLTLFVMPSKQMQDFVKLGLTVDVQMIEGMWMKPLSVICVSTM
jgi:hypothetical protein